MFTKLESQSLCIYLELLSMKGIKKSITLRHDIGKEPFSNLHENKILQRCIIIYIYIYIYPFKSLLPSSYGIKSRLVQISKSIVN